MIVGGTVVVGIRFVSSDIKVRAEGLVCYLTYYEICSFTAGLVC
jgi:hypothetical protein